MMINKSFGIYWTNDEGDVAIMLFELFVGAENMFNELRMAGKEPRLISIIK